VKEGAGGGGLRPGNPGLKLIQIHA